MNNYLVVVNDLNIVPLDVQAPRGGSADRFSDLAAAQSYADKEKSNWTVVRVYKTDANGGLEKLEEYQKGKKIFP